MSIWAHNPEWFDVWIERKALAGELGPELKARAETGVLEGYELWQELLASDPASASQLGAEASTDFVSRYE